MQFIYKAKTKTGEVVEGTLEAADRFALSRELRSRGQSPVSITEKSGGASVDAAFQKLFGGVSVEEQIIFTKNLAGMLKAGLAISRALSVLEKQTKNPTLHKVISSLIGDINSGASFSDGLAKFPKVFSKLFVSMVKAGEESGNLVGALHEIAANLEKAHNLTKKVKGALIYPGVILSAMVVIGVLMFAFVVPTLAKTFKELGVELPATTKFVIFMGNFFSNNLLLSFVLIIGAAVGGFSLVRAKFMAPYIDYLVVRLPLIGTMAKELNTARTARTLASLLLSGVSITRAMEITGDVVQNIYYKKVLKEAIEEVERGAPFSEAFKSHPELYPIMMSEMIEVGEETGKLSDMLLDIALFYEEEVENKTKNLSTIIEPVLMIFIGAGVGFFALSMITPLYSILDSIQ